MKSPLHLVMAILSNNVAFCFFSSFLLNWEKTTYSPLEILHSVVWQLSGTGKR